MNYWAEKNPNFQYNEEDWLRVSSEQAVLEAIRFAQGGANFVVLIVCGFAFHKEAFLMLTQALNLPTALILTESPYADKNVGKAPGQRALLEQSGIQLAFCNERNSLGFLSESGVPVVYLPHSYDPGRHKPVDVDGEYHSDVYFCGTLYEERQALLDGVNWDGIDARIIGPQVEVEKREVTGGVPNEVLVRHYSGTKIALNMHRTTCGVFDERLVHIASGTAYSLGPRAYEIAACGAFQICDEARGELWEVFGNSVPTFSDSQGLERLVRAYLADETARNELALEQRERVQPCTFKARAEAILLPALREVM